MNRIYYGGMTTASGGNLSIRDADGVIWITPSGTDKGSLRTEDIVRIMPSGEIIGPYPPSVEHPFHREIYKRRPDIGAVLHAHPPALVSFSVVQQLPKLSVYPFVKYKCGNIASIPFKFPSSIELSEAVGEKFERGTDIAILENHGVVTAAKDLHTAFSLLEAVNLCANIEINAMAIGHMPISISPKHMAVYMLNVASPMKEFVEHIPTERENVARRELCALVRRSYQRQMFTGEQGTYSMRLEGDSFIITPCDKDRAYLEPEDLVLIKNGYRQGGKNPSRSADLHARIYRNNQDVNSVIIAHPPHIMAFAVTDAEFDTKLISETYITLREVKKIPFGASIMQPELFAREVDLKNPVCIVENDCVIVCSSSAYAAFDSLEVLEYSAKTLVGAAQLGGSYKKMNDDELNAMKQKFGL
ncbi:MAG: class II aldolase/adducin family protein [Clostridiales bacterium]|nr:class II aldolase/adducin family protein [Clostridiales bacterium]